MISAKCFLQSCDNIVKRKCRALLRQTNQLSWNTYYLAHQICNYHVPDTSVPKIRLPKNCHRREATAWTSFGQFFNWLGSLFPTKLLIFPCLLPEQQRLFPTFAITTTSWGIASTGKNDSCQQWAQTKIAQWGNHTANMQSHNSGGLNFFLETNHDWDLY